MPDFMKILTDNFWATVVLALFIITIVSVVLGIWLEAFKVRTRSAQKMQELRNEELRLQLKQAQQKEKRGTDSSAVDYPLPKDSSWEEQPQNSYEVGYQQQR